MSIHLAADIEAGLRSETPAPGIEVDALIATAVKARLGQVPRSSSKEIKSLPPAVPIASNYMNKPAHSA